MMAVIGLINVKAVRHAWHANKQDDLVAVVTFVLTLAFAPHLDKGILIGDGHEADCPLNIVCPVVPPKP